MENKQHTCMECEKKVTSLTYAIYSGEEVVGYLCDTCRVMHKIKPLKEKKPFEKLAKLKEQLNK